MTSTSKEYFFVDFRYFSSKKHPSSTSRITPQDLYYDESIIQVVACGENRCCSSYSELESCYIPYNPSSQFLPLPPSLRLHFYNSTTVSLHSYYSPVFLHISWVLPVSTCLPVSVYPTAPATPILTSYGTAGSLWTPDTL